MARKFPKAIGKGKLSANKGTQSDNGRDIVILFADVVGCSEISNHLILKDYSKFITSFQECFERVCKYYKDNAYEKSESDFFQFKARGDEGCLKIFIAKSEKDLARDVDVAISIALDLKKMWLFSERNRDRIKKEKLLPVELAIGIHMGKVWLKDDGQPEGYAINLAKRIESASRDGKFTHIFVSEAAHGQLYYHKEERVYKFTDTFPIPTKGISQEIRVGEVKHHFLPTDWQDVVEEEPWEISMVYPELGHEDILSIAQCSYQLNPTNLWLAEEYLLLTMMDAYRKTVEQNKKGDIKYLEKMGYGKALEIVQRIANSDLRNGTLLSEWGLILGELERYEEEEEKYREAIRLEESDPDFHWYLGLCLSYKIARDMEADGLILEAFYKEQKNRVDEVLREYKLALDLSPMNPWIAYVYACELSQWSQADIYLRERAVELLVRALGQKNDIRDWAKEEDYLKPIIEDPRIKKCLGSK